MKEVCQLSQEKKTINQAQRKEQKRLPTLIFVITEEKEAKDEESYLTCQQYHP